MIRKRKRKDTALERGKKKKQQQELKGGSTAELFLQESVRGLDSRGNVQSQVKTEIDAECVQTLFIHNDQNYASFLSNSY